MKQNTLIALVVAAAGLSALAWFLGEREQSSYTPTEIGLFAPEFEARLDEINGVDIHAAGEEAFGLLRNDAGDWVVPSKADYAVDTGKLRKVLRTLATAKIVEAKTANPEWHERLKLQDIGEAADTTIELVAKAGAEPVLGVLIGRTGQGGQYVRRMGDNQTWLIDERLAPAKKAADWLDKTIVDIKRADLRSLEVSPIEGEPWSLSRLGDSTTDFDLKPAEPEGRERNGANNNRILSALSSLRLLDVRASEPADAEAAWQTLRFRQFDGLAVELKIRKDEDDFLLQLAAEQTEAWEAPAAEGEENEANRPAVDTAAVAERVAAINARANGRVFEVSSYPGTGLMMDYEKMLKEPPADSSE